MHAPWCPRFRRFTLSDYVSRPASYTIPPAKTVRSTLVSAISATAHRIRRYPKLFPELTTAPAAVDAATVFVERMGDAVGNVVRCFIRKGSGFCYWRPTRRMRSLGFRLVPLGKDGLAAWATAEEWNKKWDAVRLGEAPPLTDLSKRSRDEAEAVRRYLADRSGPPSNVISELQSGRLTPPLPETKSGGQLGFAFATCGETSHPTQSLSR
jgi:hypothetical protein